MRARDPRLRPARLLGLAAGVFALAGCGSNSAGDVRLRAASMTSPNDDQRLQYDTVSSLRFAPP